MKKLVAMSFLLSCILLIGGCQETSFKDKQIVSPPEGRDVIAPLEEDSETSKDAVHPIVEQEFMDYANLETSYNLREDVREDPDVKEIQEMIVADYQDFAGSLFQKVALEQPGDFIFSPVSAYLPMMELRAVSNEGSVEEDQLRKTLFPVSNEPQLTKKIKDLFNMDGYTLGSSVWIGSIFSPNEEKLKELLSSSDLYQVDFTSKEAEKAQMEWINKWTKGFLAKSIDSEFLKVEDPNIIRLFGTAHFKSNWDEDFFDEEKDTFFGKSGEKKMTFLKSSLITSGASYLEHPNFQAAKIPLRMGNSFVVILPKEGMSPRDLLKENVLKTIYESSFEGVDLNIDMPKFENTSSLDLLSSIKNMGCDAITIPSLQYPALSGLDKEIFVSGISQNAKIDVNKDGLEAAAVTKMEIAMDSAAFDERKVVDLKVDRPYIYIVESSNNLPGFLGINEF